jgi:tight adherence protein B
VAVAGKHVRYCRAVNAARLAVGAPWLVLLLLGTQSGSLGNFDSSGGLVLLAAGAGTCLAAYRIMRRIARLPDEPRVLR